MIAAEGPALDAAEEKEEELSERRGQKASNMLRVRSWTRRGGGRGRESQKQEEGSPAEFL